MQRIKLHEAAGSRAGSRRACRGLPCRTTCMATYHVAQRAWRPTRSPGKHGDLPLMAHASLTRMPSHSSLGYPQMSRPSWLGGSVGDNSLVQGGLETMAVFTLCGLANVSASSSGHRFKAGDDVPLYANKVGPYHNPRKKREALGEVLNGDRLVSAPYRLESLTEKEAEIACKRKLTKKEVAKFRTAVSNDYYFQIYYLFKHLIVEIHHNKDQVIEVTVRSDPNALVDLTEDDPVDVDFMYTVQWKETNTPFEKRMDKYSLSSSLPHHLEIHWFSIINSRVTVLLLTGFLATILMRVLKNDFIKYAHDDESADDQDESGWKYIHSDVFKYPKNKSLFAAALGCGTQLFTLALVVIYALTSGIAGYTAASFYCEKLITSWKLVLWISTSAFTLSNLPVNLVSRSLIIVFGTPQYFTTCFRKSRAASSAGHTLDAGIKVPYLENLSITTMMLENSSGTLIIKGGSTPFIYTPQVEKYKLVFTLKSLFFLFRFLNTVAITYKATAALPFGTIVVILLIWALVTSPLLVVGGITGKNRKEEFQAPCLTTKHPREIPPLPWSFFCGGSTGLFIYAYCLYYYIARSNMSSFMQTSFFFGYMACICYGFFLMLGAIGFRASLPFVRHIYHSIKCD
ncbi:Transmembrane 9 superfamily member 4 [Hibiscus syriacus]|uniref:Transmembrane 9 superfamily member n=1 Tax=Hibiscus syriacus TaxID=106335 RepID=A0A6A2XC17_HIBSY|nr:Transmembrane 9 superfamily member 4 [Hibiscus syriacus]